MKKKLEITLEKARELYPKASKEIKEIFESTFGKEALLPSITDRINDLGDINLILGRDVSIYSRSHDKKANSKHAFALLLEVVEVYNEGWEPDWDNSNQYKYFVYYYKSDGRWLACSGHWPSYHLYCPSGLYFKSRELCEDAMRKFKWLFEDYFMVS